MKTINVSLNQLVPHESSAVKSRIKRLSNAIDDHEPIVVKPITGTTFYSIYQGHNRAKRAFINGETSINAIVAPPDFLTRNDRIYQQRIREYPDFPLESLRISDGDNERKDWFYQETSFFQASPRLNTHRGTILMLEILVRFDDEEVAYKSLPLKGDLGALLLEPEYIDRVFCPSVFDKEHISQCWGSDKHHDPSVLPAYLELGSNTIDIRGGGYAHDISFKESSDSEDHRFALPAVSRRPKVVSVSSLVVYPAGNIWKGLISNCVDRLAAIIWSDKLALGLVDEKKRSSFAAANWWSAPTSLVFGFNDQSFESISKEIVTQERCGSTCVGGGCLI
jgi:hypothetical protein